MPLHIIGITITLLLPPAVGYATSPIQVSNNWVRAAPATMRVRAAYMTISNASDNDIELIEISSPMFESVEMHETKISNQIVTMQKRNRINIEAGAEFHFEPSGYHLMLMRPKAEIKEGDKVQIDLRFSNADSVSVMMPIKSIASTHPH